MQTKIDYEEEVEIVERRDDIPFWKSTPGKYKIKVGAEPTMSYNPLHEIDQLRLDVTVDGVPHVWTVGKGISKKSTYYQLMLLGAHYKGLAGLEFDVFVAGEGKSKTIVIPQCLELAKQDQEQKVKEEVVK